MTAETQPLMSATAVEAAKLELGFDSTYAACHSCVEPQLRAFIAAQDLEALARTAFKAVYGTEDITYSDDPEDKTWDYCTVELVVAAILGREGHNHHD